MANEKEQSNNPRHVGIIMDGNGRWAKKRMMPRNFGHRQGAKAFRNITTYARDLGLEYLTVYAFSTENWKRPQKEIDSIMELLKQYLDEGFKKANERIRIHFIGDISPLDDELKGRIKMLEEDSRHIEYTMTLNIALNYGGRFEITSAAKEIAKQAAAGTLQPGDIDEALFEKYLYTAGQPDPELIIRPSGEMRLSNFLTWQSAYSEFVFMDILWPDFKGKHLEEAIEIYKQRNRRFGGL